MSVSVNERTYTMFIYDKAIDIKCYWKILWTSQMSKRIIPQRSKQNLNLEDIKVTWRMSWDATLESSAKLTSKKKLSKKS